MVAAFISFLFSIHIIRALSIIPGDRMNKVFTINLCGGDAFLNRFTLMEPGLHV